MEARKHRVHTKPATALAHALTRGVLVIAGVAALGMSMPSVVKAQSVWQQPEFMVGTWEDPVTPSLGSWDLHYFQQAKDAHFNLLTGTVTHYTGNHFSSSSYAQQLDKLDAAQKVGLRVLLSHMQHTGALNEPAVPFNRDIPPDIFSMYDQVGANAITNAQNDAMMGYYLWDEPPFDTPHADFIKNWVAAIHNDNAARNDGHRRVAYLNLTPGCGDYTCYPSTIPIIVSDADPNRQLDVVSTDLYPFAAQPTNPTLSHYYWTPMRDLKAVMGARPFWIVTMLSPSAAGGPFFSDPDDAQLRFMAFCPPAAGAKGIMWFNYRSLSGSVTETDYPILGDDIPTCKYYRVKTINHYLQDVVGPVVMANNHLGVFHQANQPPMDPDQSLTFVSAAPAASCPATNLGNPNFVTGVFQPTGSTNEYYLFIVNKSLSAQSGTVALRSTYDITAAPSVLGFVGGDSFNRYATGTTFNVSLAGGEGRMFRLTTTSQNAIALTAPVGGETWRVGEAHTVTWAPNTAMVDILLVADALETDPGITGPTVVLASGATGGSRSVTIPNVSSRSAHIVLVGTTTASHNTPIITAPVDGAASYSSAFTSAGCSMPGGTVALDLNGNPMLAYTTFATALRTQRFDGNQWTPASPFPYNWGSGISSSLAFNSANRPHIAHQVGLPFTPTWLYLSYINASGNWAAEQVCVTAEGNGCALAIGPGDDVRIAFSDEATNGTLAIRHKVNGEWVDVGPMPASNHPHDIQLAVDASGSTYVTFIDGEPALERLVVAKVTPTTATTMLVLLGQFRQASLALDPTGKPSIAYVQETGVDGGCALRYRAYTGSAWGPIKLVDGSAGTMAGCALAFEGMNPRIAYVGNRVAKYAALSGSTWVLSTLFGGADADAPVALKFSTGGQRWAGFFDRTSDGFRVVGPPTNGGGDIGCPGCEPGERMPAITYHFDNPVQVGRALAFEMRLPRQTSIEMALFDVAGRRVAHFAPRTYGAGLQHIQWTPNTSRAGAYFLRVQSDGQTLGQKRLIVLQ